MSAVLVGAIVLGTIAAVIRIALDDADQRATTSAPGGRAAVPVAPALFAPRPGAPLVRSRPRLRTGLSLVLVVVFVGTAVALVIGVLAGLAALTWLS